MPYQLSSTLGRKCSPNAKAIDGDTSQVRAADASRDTGLAVEPPLAMSGGRRVLPDGVPTKVYWKSSYIRDYETVLARSVSKDMRDLIEFIEPRIHQFLPVTFCSQTGATLEDRLFWVICNRLDTVHREHTTFELDRGILWRGDRIESPTLIFESARIGGHHFWVDKHLLKGPFLSFYAGDELRKAKLTGFGLIRKEEA